MTRPLSALIPLRTTSVWPGYGSIEIIPRVYGRARVRPIRYNTAGTQYVLADHALAGVDAVTLDGKSLPGWAWQNGFDMTGHSSAFLQLSSAPESGTLAATVRGLSGNPADILMDIYPRNDLQDFRIWCANQELMLGGALDTKITIRAALSFVLDQIGAVWSAGLPGFAVSFPPSADAPIWASLGPLDIASWSVECALDELVTRLTMPFDWDYAAGQAAQSLIAEAPAVAKIHGAREAELSLPWVKDVRQALAVATRWLQWRARPRWIVQFETGPKYRDLQPGVWIDIQHLGFPQSGEYVVTDVDPGYGKGGVMVTAQAPAGLVPTVALVQSSTVF